MYRTVRQARLLALSVGLALFAAVGCGGSEGTLSGKVTYNGANLKGGTVLLVAEQGNDTFTGSIQEDGTYIIPHVRSGKYKVCVETASLKGPSGPAGGYNMGPKGPAGKPKNEAPKGANVPEGYRMSDPAANKARFVEIPGTYGDPAQTSLRVEVKGGQQTHDIPLT
jgi:hypothetical protein